MGKNRPRRGKKTEKNNKQLRKTCDKLRKKQANN